METQLNLEKPLTQRLKNLQIDTLYEYVNVQTIKHRMSYHDLTKTHMSARGKIKRWRPRKKEFNRLTLKQQKLSGFFPPVTSAVALEVRRPLQQGFKDGG